MRDLETGTLWSHILGEAMKGELKGEKLRNIPATVTDWRSWKAGHPETTVLALNRTSEEFVTEFHRRPGAFVVGLWLYGAAKAYPFDRLSEYPVVNDVFQDVPLVVAFDPESTAARVFERQLEDRLLTFATGSKSTAMTDQETGSVWVRTTGRCAEGVLKGAQLDPLPGIISFRRAWEAFHPESEMMGAPADGE
jgi:hypothetical protein